MWNEACGTIFSQYVEALNKNHIKYFVLRNYELLPEQNIGKDVDIVIEPQKLKTAKKILKKVYLENGVHYYDEARFDRMHCTHGMDIENHIGIHIDLIGGYLAKGYEIYTFDELYSNVEKYKNFYVLGDFLDGIMLLVYKLFGYRKPKLKEKYKLQIRETCMKNAQRFQEELERISHKRIAYDIVKDILTDDFDGVINKNEKFTKALKRRAILRKPVRTIGRRIRFIWQKLGRTIFLYKKYVRCFAVLAPDGTGKTTFLEALINELNYYYVSDEKDNKFRVYHFRPTVLPNLGAVGEKVGVMEQDKDWTNPHRGKAANPLSSLARIAYYTMDYLIGWQICVRKDVHYDRFSIFDRYSYDFIVDPLRTKLGLPKWVRKFFVRLTPQPKIVFILDADPDVIYSRKQELTKEEIARQLSVYRELEQSHKRYVRVDAQQNPEEMAKQALKYILRQYTEKLEI